MNDDRRNDEHERCRNEEVAHTLDGTRTVR